MPSTDTPRVRNPISQVTEKVAGPARFLGAVFGLVFFGVGLTVIIFMWSQPFNGFDSPPLFFRVFASFIALAFVAMGGTLAYGSIFKGGMMGEVSDLADEAIRQRGAQLNGQTSAASVGYVCPNCGAALGEKADVSPLGDVKCPFCGTWFNIHRRM